MKCLACGGPAIWDAGEQSALCSGCNMSEDGCRSMPGGCLRISSVPKPQNP